LSLPAVGRPVETNVDYQLVNISTGSI